MDTEVFLTGDGSHSLRSVRFGAAYHSTHGAVQESRHIFIEAGLRPILERANNPVTVLELGFGTGLNAVLTWQLADRLAEVMVRYISFEPYPIGISEAAALNYPQRIGMSPDSFLRLHEQPTADGVALSEYFSLHRRAEDFLSANPSPVADLIYYDAFAPEQQPELWTVEAMRHAARWLRPGGSLVTYCAKGQFKRNLRAAGFRVTALPGPVGKREITRGDLIDLPQVSV